MHFSAPRNAYHLGLGLVSAGLLGGNPKATLSNLRLFLARRDTWRIIVLSISHARELVPMCEVQIVFYVPYLMSDARFPAPLFYANLVSHACPWQGGIHGGISLSLSFTLENQSRCVKYKPSSCMHGILCTLVSETRSGSCKSKKNMLRTHSSNGPFGLAVSKVLSPHYEQYYAGHVNKQTNEKEKTNN